MANYYCIDTNAHYFIPMHPLEGIDGLLLFTSSNTREKWVECAVVEECYKVDDGYKVELRALEPGYGKETFYQCDFASMINAGRIIKKERPTQHTEEVRWAEPIGGNNFLVTSAYVVVG